ncbi:MAG: hypothetical protein HY720_26770 [Planctomycetes bacterium]|nr:hypothetical protein [Planctomycetota bacterium]
MTREIWVEVELSSVEDAKRPFTLRALVDNGSTESAFPGSVLRDIGVHPEGWETYESWAGKTHRRRWGHVRIEIYGVSRICVATFEPEAEVPTIGATTLEALGFDINMRDGGLRPFRRRAPRIRRRPGRRLR